MGSSDTPVSWGAPTRKRLGVLLAALALLSLAFALMARPASAMPCAPACVVHLPPSPDRVSGWTSHYRLSTSLLEVEVRSHREEIPFNRSSQEGCVAWFIGKGVKLQLAACEPQPLVFIAYKARKPVKVRINAGAPRLGPAPGFGLDPAPAG